jgi:SAM-dependent methyltransferase
MHATMSLITPALVPPQCPTCQAHDYQDFLTIKSAPIQSVVTLKSNWAAMQIPRKDIILSFCHQCGFIFNRNFEKNWDYYTNGYEDQQGFSPTFVNFITGITQRLIEKYQLYQGVILEIGCGKGDFLRLISKLGNNRGIGIDPAWRPGRVKDEEQLTFITDFYAAKYGRFKADCIVCRHTLEHVYDADKFLHEIRTACGNSKPILFFEVPCILRILKDLAFWDIFGEHCAYFSPGSLARLFRRNGFKVLDLHIEYEQQYLFIEARPVAITSTSRHALEESPLELFQLAETFALRMQEKINLWRTRLYEFKLAQKKVVLWGGGSKAVGFLTQFHEIGIISHVIDINPYLTGNFIPSIGLRYVEPAAMQDFQPDIVITMNSVYINEVKQQLTDMGLQPEVIGL